MENKLTEQLIINIPSSTTSRYVITTNRRIDRPEEFVLDLLATNTTLEAEQLASRLRQMINTPEVRIRPHAADDSPYRAELPRLPAHQHEDTTRALAASWHIVIDSETSPARQPQRAQMVRALARRLADAVDGQLADLCTAEFVWQDPDNKAERGWFRAADAWLGIDCRIHPDARMDTSAECECLCLFTRGLSRFGLPELLIDRVTCDYDLAATNALRGIAIQLLRRLWANPTARQLRLDETVVVEPKDVWAYWGARPLYGGPVPLQITHANRDDLPNRVAHLELLPRPDYHGARVQWNAHVLTQGVSSVAGWLPDNPPYRIDRQAVFSTPRGSSSTAGQFLDLRRP